MMKTILSLLVLSASFALTACGSSSSDSTAQDTPQVFSINDCPVLAGSYVADGQSKVITEKRTSDSYSVILGDGAEEMKVDGAQHSSDGSASYKAYCKEKALVVELSMGSTKGKMRFHFNDQGQLVDEDSGADKSRTIWTKL